MSKKKSEPLPPWKMVVIGLSQITCVLFLAFLLLNAWTLAVAKIWFGIVNPLPFKEFVSPDYWVFFAFSSVALGLIVSFFRSFFFVDSRM